MDRLKSLLASLSHWTCFPSQRSNAQPQPQQPTIKKTLSTSSTDPDPITLLIAHGAFQTQYHYQLYIDALHQNTDLTRILCPQQSSSGPSPPADSFQADVKMLHRIVCEEISSGRDVLVVCHSYGGIPGCEALADLPTEPTVKGGRLGKVLGIVFVSAFVAEAGQSLITSKMAGRAAWVRIEGALSHVNNPTPTLFSTLPQTSPLATNLTSALVPQASASFTATTSHATWQNLPCYYIRCTADQAMVPAEQDYFIARLRESCSPGAKVRELAADHAPFASMPKELARLTEEIVGELTSA